MKSWSKLPKYTSIGSQKHPGVFVISKLYERLKIENYPCNQEIIDSQRAFTAIVVNAFVPDIILIHDAPKF